MLTELEGTILAEVHRLGPCTAYQIRLGFQNSQSREWAASTGAIYPALRRLRLTGLVEATAAPTRRGAEHLSLTEAGQKAMRSWVEDVDRATGSGFDPFRTRCGYWATMPSEEMADLIARLERVVADRITALQAIGEEAGPPESTWRERELELQQMRLRWLRTRAG